jgi:hypothetical protein
MKKSAPPGVPKATTNNDGVKPNEKTNQILANRVDGRTHGGKLLRRDLRP